MNRSTLRTQLMLVGAVGIAFCPAVSLAAPVASWDQARVTSIAKDLAKTVDDLYRSEYKAPAESYLGVASGGDAYHQFMDTLRRMQHESRHLAMSLEKGAGAKATTGSVKHIGELSRDLAEYGRMMTFVNPVPAQFAKFEDLIRQLAAYYGLDRKG